MAGRRGKGREEGAGDGVLSFGWISVLCVFGCLLDLVLKWVNSRYGTRAAAASSGLVKRLFIISEILLHRLLVRLLMLPERRQGFDPP